MLCSDQRSFELPRTTQTRSKSEASLKRATYKVPEAAAVAGCGQREIRKGVAAGRIPHIKFGRNIVIPKVAFEQWLNSAAGSVSH
jgi:excisionase family DNA binding protein